MWRIKGWEKFQHFSDRKPPWVKLYRTLLDDLEWHQLDPLAAKSLVMMWLIAAEKDGMLPDLKTLSFRLRQTENVTKSIVSKLSHWLIQVDNNVISSGYQKDALETETEKETELERETDIPAWLDANIWISFKQHRGKKFTAKAQFLTLKKLTEFKQAGQDCNKILETSIANGWSGVFPEKVNGHGYLNPRDESRKRTIRELTGYDADAIPTVSTCLD